MARLLLLVVCCVWLGLVLNVEAQKFCDGDCYDLLGLTQRATKEDIKRVYKKYSRMYHPDKKPGQAGVEKFKKIAQAYEVLIDDKTRRKYDREIRNPSGWVSGDGDFVGQSGEINVKVILVALGICVAVMAYVAFKFLNVQELFASSQKQGKPRKPGKAGKVSAKNDKTN